MRQDYTVGSNNAKGGVGDESRVIGSFFSPRRVSFKIMKSELRNLEKSLFIVICYLSSSKQHSLGHFSSSLEPLFQNESKCETFHMKTSSACSFIFIRMVLHLDSL